MVPNRSRGPHWGLGGWVGGQRVRERNLGNGKGLFHWEGVLNLLPRTCTVPTK